ncbi:hypothetical protein Aoki45_08000 [Algoriphagus sp. oki45]|uniref:hypothetical protein n=1 Tax=Algoriphagus sp. oki45 TaxID=3067294 RepID=UPI0027EEFF12|nr:hypothetical protein Aoki45_08000 [Algoriphagus sp. oki45]
MKKSVLHFALGLAILGIIFSCKTYRNVENLPPKVSKELQDGPFVNESLLKLIEGDKIQLITLSGETYNMTFIQVKEDKVVAELRGKNGRRVNPSQNIEFPIGEIDRLYTRRVSAEATVAFGLLSALGILFGIYALAVSSGGGYWKTEIKKEVVSKIALLSA